MEAKPNEVDLNPWCINLLRRLEDLLDLMISPGFELLSQGGSHRKPRSSNKAPGGRPVDYELWRTLGQLTTEFRDSDSPIGQALSEPHREEILSRFPTVASLAEGTFGEVFCFLRAATWVPLDRDDLEEQEFTRLIRQSRFDDVFDSGRITAALQRLKDLCKPTFEDILRVLRFRPIFDSLTLDEFRSWNDWFPIEVEPGVQVLHVPYPSYHPVVSEWNDAVYCTPFYINPYREVSGKEGGVPPPRFLHIGDRGHPTPEQFFADADLDEVRQYMAVCLRGEKWCDGHIAGEFKRGVIQAAFNRLKELVEENP